jgi:hypothetical protein
VLEINAVLADGGLLFLATHQSWPPHELPWDFWRYSPSAFQALLNRHTGFEIVRAEMGLPALIVPMVSDEGMADVHRNPASLGVSVLARKVSPPRPDLRWDLTAADVLETEYPAPGGGPRKRTPCASAAAFVRA